MVTDSTTLETSSIEEQNEEENNAPNFAFEVSQSFEDMDWWPELGDLDRLNILNSPKEDRARLLASKYSKPMEEIMVEIGEKTDLEYLEDFELPENPTKLLPMRLIHNYCCLPTEINEGGKLSLVTPWPPSERMSRWVYAVSGCKPLWSLGSPEKNFPRDYRAFWNWSRQLR